MSATTLPVYKKKDFQSDQDVRWCPGCGDYAILSAVQSVFPELGIPKEKFVVVSGIGCSSRFPYYMNTYGFHSDSRSCARRWPRGSRSPSPTWTSGWPPATATPSPSAGTTRSTCSGGTWASRCCCSTTASTASPRASTLPTSEIGKKAKSTPYGSLDRPFRPLSLALGAEATFVARSVDIFQPHLKGVLKKAASHTGSAFIEVLQNCNIFNDGAWERADPEGFAATTTPSPWSTVSPSSSARAQDKGIRLNGLDLEVVTLGKDAKEEDLLVHDEKNPNPAYAFLLSRMDAEPGLPTPLGVLRAIDTMSYEQEVADQVRAVTKKKGDGDLEALLHAGDTWEVK